MKNKGLQDILILGLLLFLILCVPINKIQGQVLNVEQYALDADTSEVWKGSLAFGFNISKQRSRVFDLRNDANLTYFSRNSRYMFLNRIHLLDVGQDTNLSDGYFLLRGTFMRRSRINPEAFLQFQYNFDTGLQRRFLTGGAGRFNLFTTEYSRWSMSTGLMYENEVWLSETEEQRLERNLIKSTTSLNVQGQLTENLNIILFGYYQARPDRMLKPRVTADAQLQFGITDNLRLSVQWVSTYDAAPVLDAPEWVYTLTNNIIFSF